MERRNTHIYFGILGVIVLLSFIIMLGMSNSTDYSIPHSKEVRHYENFQEESVKQTEKHITELNEPKLNESKIPDGEVGVFSTLTTQWSEATGLSETWFYIIMFLIVISMQIGRTR